MQDWSNGFVLKEVILNRSTNCVKYLLIQLMLQFKKCCKQYMLTIQLPVLIP